jgi:hypothetical protein
MTEKEIIKLSFCGEALKDGSMDVKEFAPILIALDDLFDETNKYLTHGGDKITIKINSKIEKGSFECFIEIIKSSYQQVIEVLNSKDVIALVNFLAILGISGFGGLGLFQLIKKSKGEKPINITQINNSITIEFKGEEPIVVDKSVYDIFNNPRTRDASVRIVRPLRNEGFDNIEIYHKSKIAVTVNKSEAKFFKPLFEEGDKHISEAVRIFQIVALSFNEKNKWRLTDGKAIIYVSILDEDFRNRIKSGEIRFGKNDYFKVKLRITQWYDGEDLKADYEIIKVIDHNNNPQPKLPFGKTNNK